MPNRYADTCYKCGKVCEPNAGVFEKVSRAARAKWPNLARNIRWQTQHHECVRDYARDAHYLHNPQAPLHNQARYQIERTFLKGTPT